jgi:hypothetical protein
MNDREDKGRQASVEGYANEHIALGILMKKYQNVSLVDLPLSSYDIIIVFKQNNKEIIIRGQVKTATISVSFTGGTRGGVDREYKSGIKEYIQSPEKSDVVIGVNQNDLGVFDLYFIPTILIAEINQKSISLRKIQSLRNNYDILERCKDQNYVLEQSKLFGIIS